MPISNLTLLDPNNFSLEKYSVSDETLIDTSTESNQFDVNTDYVEFFVYDLANNIVSPRGNDGTFSNYTILDNEIYVNPSSDLERIGIDNGIVNIVYNFYRKWLSSSPQSTYYIKEISSDRTEIRLDSNIISKADIATSTAEFISYREQDANFPDFYLNLGSNNLLIANNILLDSDGTVLIKLYESLPANIDTKTSLWVVEKISVGLAYRVEFDAPVILPPSYPQLSGPNYNLNIKDELNNSTEAVSLDSFTSPNSQSEYQINSYFEDPSISINIDYSDFSNFVNFSSAQSRIENFFTKMGTIESASAVLDTYSSLNDTAAVSASKASINKIINDTITTFDSYEYYLYFESSSDTYPKSNLTPPYNNVSTGSAAAIAWYDNKILEAENYDNQNQNWLYYAAPEYIRDDSDNEYYLTFLNMIGHFVDNDIWVYIKDTTNKWDADNRINAGVSKDLVAQVLRDLGIKIYQNNYSSGDLYSAFLGFTDSGSLFPYPYMTGSLPTPSGYEYISNFISSSDEAIPLDDINKRIYKRIYHNLPYLLKSKGTVAGLRTLITSYGIPDTILRISEFGGKDRNNVNDWDLWKHQYNYKADKTTDRAYITSDWQLNSNWNSEDNRPMTLQFRFNAGLPSGSFGIVEASQSLWQPNLNTAIVLEYDTASAEIPVADTYSGSIVDPTYQYATLKFTPDNFTTTASITLPFLDGDWWNVSVTKVGSNFTLWAGNKIYSGSDGSQIGFFATSSITGDPSFWDSSTTSWFPTRNGVAVTLGTGTYEPFSGSYQEIRYFAYPLSENVFKDYVMNPQSTEGFGINSSPEQLAFRASLGGELYTGSVSVHPKVSGPTGYPTSSFATDSDFTLSEIEFNTNREWVFYDSPPVGIKNRNTDKIKQQELILPSGDTLSNLGSIQQKSYTTQDYTNNLNLLEVAFSPQNQINDDIISQIGYFNVGDYIGDPRLISSSANTYPSLVELSKQYFDKYSSNYDVYDYIRLIKFFDNSLFKMVKDFVPARTGIASGIVIKQHILERQKYPVPQATWTQPEYTGSIGQTPTSSSDYQKMYQASTDFESNPIVTVEGGAGGSVNEFNRPVAFFRVTDIPNVGLNSITWTTLLNQSPTSLFAGANNPGVTLNPDGINNGEFRNGTGYDVTTNFTFSFKNPSAPIEVTIQLVEVDGKVVKEVFQDLPTWGASAIFTYYFNNVTLKAGKSYFFRAKSNTSQSINTFDVRFFQEDAPLPLRNGQFYEVTNITPVGDLTQVIGDSHEFYDGEFSGSSIVATDGELNTECDPFKEANTQTITYNLSGSFDLDTYNFLNKLGGADYAFTSVGGVGLGKTLLFWKLERQESADRFGTPYWTWYYQIAGFGIKIPNSLNGIDVEDYIANATSFTFQNPNFLASDFTVGASWSSATGEGLQNNSTNLTLIPTGIQKRTAYPNLASGGQYYYISTEPSDLTFIFSTPKSAGYGDFDDITVAAKSALELLIEPYLPTEFENSDCNPLYGNATKVKPSVTYYDLDYSQGSITPVNFETVIAGTATKAPLQDYNYFARRSIIPRYSGSKNTSNLPYDTTSNVINQFSGSNQPIERRDSIITEFDWGGGTYPEIYDGGGVQLRQHLFVGNTRTDVNVQVTTEDGFVNTLKQTYPLNSTPSIQQYTTVSGNAVGARVAGYGFSVPSRSTFALPADDPLSSILAKSDNKIYMTASYEVYNVTNDSNGFETIGNQTTGQVVYDTLNDSLVSGDRWYITFYEDMPDTLQGVLTPFTGETNFYSQRNSRGEYLDPLKSRGVWRIADVESSSGTIRIELADNVDDLFDPSNPPFPPQTIPLGGSGGTVGFLIWKAKVNDNLMIFVDATMSGVGKSGMTTDSPTSVVEQNFDYITRNFGSNTTTS